ncbi:MAG: hypothetical protein QOG57_7257, partial [Pseudonocardiales bacterium]|nr:hypothetical protein [Pseudonocardiales bacterium]
ELDRAAVVINEPGPSLAGHRHRPAARVQHGGRRRRVRDGPGRADRAAGANPGSPGRRRGTGHRRPASAPVARRDGAAPAVPALRGGVQPSSGTSLAHEIPDASCLGTGRSSTSLPRMPPEQVLQRESVGGGGDPTRAFRSPAQSRRSRALPPRCSRCFPSPNSSGNFQKVTQVIPVKIALTTAESL